MVVTGFNLEGCDCLILDKGSGNYTFRVSKGSSFAEFVLSSFDLVEYSCDGGTMYEFMRTIERNEGFIRRSYIYSVYVSGYNSSK